MLDVALVNFVGAGLASFAPVYGFKVPKGAITNGTLLVRSLYQHDRSGTGDIVEATVQAIWQDWINSGMPNSVAEAHLARLPQILEENQPDPDVLVGAYAVTNAAAKLTVTAVEAQARRISTDIIENARNNDSETTEGLSENVIFFFLEALYRNLLPARRYVDDAKMVIESFLEERRREHSVGEPTSSATPVTPSRSPEPAEETASVTHHAKPFGSDGPQNQANTTAAAPEINASPSIGETADQIAAAQKHDDSKPEITATDEKIEPAANISVSRATLIAAARSALAKRVGSEAAEKRDIEKSIGIGLELAVCLAGCKDSDAEYRNYVEQALQHLHAGAMADVQSALAVAENTKRNSARAEPDAPEDHLRAAAEARCWRGQLQEMLFEFRGAARHYAEAARHLDDTDFERRWLYTERQIMALVRLDEEFAEADALVEATKTCTSHLVVLLDERARNSQARAKLLLGQLLIALGEREADSERFRLAGGHLKEALSYYSKSDQKHLQNRAKLLWADALAGLGAASDDPRALEEAIRAYQDLHSSPKSAAKPEPDNKTSIKLGIALSHLGATTKNEDILDVAIETLRTGIEALDEDEKADSADHNELLGRANAALARAIVAKSGISQDEEALGEAEAIYRLAIAALSGNRTRIELRKLCDEHTALRRRSSPESQLDAVTDSDSAEDGKPTPSQETSGDMGEQANGGGYLSRLRASLKLAQGSAPDAKDENALKSA